MKSVKKKICFTALISFTVLLVTSIVSLTVGVYKQLKAAFDIDETTYYTYTDEHGVKFRCFIIKEPEPEEEEEGEGGEESQEGEGIEGQGGQEQGQGGEEQGQEGEGGESEEEPVIPKKRVCIAWFYGDKDAPQVVPETIDVPKKVTLNSEDYEVVSILKGGFRSLTFTTINLPYTIQEIGEEAFAYCMNMTSFSIPYQVSVIPSSAFMDCQNLEMFYYTGIVENAEEEEQEGEGGQEQGQGGEEQEEEGEEEPEIERKMGNDVITEIGDHAFDNCKKLKGLYFPSTLTSIGNSAFQRCELLQSLFFPGASDSLTIGAYAFADCPILKSVYFEENLKYVGPYAFANCKQDLTFTYTGSSVPTTFDKDWRDKNTTTANNYVYDFAEFNAQHVVIDSSYPGLIYTFETSDVYLNSAGSNRPTVKVIENSGTYVKISGFQEPFATPPNGYYNVDTKKLTVPNVIKDSTGVDRPVKVIGATAFAGSPIKKVKFNKNLVQIQTRAFWGCSTSNKLSYVDELDFTDCENLKEISYEIFQSPCPELSSTKTPDKYTNDQVFNASLTRLDLPNCLEYLGDSAFYNFTNLTGGIHFQAHDANSPSKLKVIGDFCFSVHRTHKANVSSTNLFDLVLPNSLDDRYVIGGEINGVTYTPSNYYHPYTPTWVAGDILRVDRYAVGRFCFENQDLLGTVTMEKATSSQENDNYHTTSFLSNAFVRCNNIRKFQSNKNFYLMGTDSFKLCPNLKECFFYSEKAQWQFKNNGGAKFPWGIRDNGATDGGNETYDNGMFARQNEGDGNLNPHPDTVIYVSGSSAPGWLDMPEKYKSGSYFWNRDQTNTLLTGLQSSGDAGKISNKKQIPTFYNCVWEGSGINVLYWKPNNTYKALTSSDANYQYTLSATEYNEGYIAIAPAKSESSGKYSIVKYFSDGASGHIQNEIDLSNICTIGTHNAISSNLIEIAGCAFATDVKNKILGRFFVLPPSVERIGERAFFRKSSGNEVGIVTYKSGDTIKVPSGVTDKTYSDLRDAFKTSVGGYCILPPNVTRIEANSFFNNNFKTIEIGENVEYLGASAFTVKDYTNRVASATMESTQNPLFESENDGLYYTKVSSKKMLVYQAGGTSSDTLEIASGTKAIGFRAAIKTNYKKINFPSGLKIIYGSAFNSAQMEEIGGDVSSLQYINATVLTGDTEVYDDYTGTLPFDNYDVTPINGWDADDSRYIAGSRAGAFVGCGKLKKVDFSSMTSLRVIGQDAFNGCKVLESGSKETYNIYSYVGKGLAGTAQLTTYNPASTGGNKIVDLSNSTNLASIKTGAFKDDTLISITILPNSTLTSKSVTEMPRLTLDNDSNVLPPSSIHLIGDTYHQAGLLYNDVDPSHNHYPLTALRSSEDYNYYRFWVDGLPEGLTIDNYLAKSYDQSLYNILRYWTVYGGNYYLFQGYEQAKAFYDLVTTSQYLTPGQALQAS